MAIDNVEGWPWLPNLCPPDLDFINYMREKQFSPKTILHTGTGLHHRVGIECCEMGHKVIGVTVSREEVVSRVFRVDDTNYQVFYANINTLNVDLLPKLDIVTLFHFGEMESDFGPVSNDVLLRLLNKMPLDGFMAFYHRSAAWDRAKVAVDYAVKQEYLHYVETAGEIEIYRKWQQL